MMTMEFKENNEDVFLIGGSDNYKNGWMGQSLFAREIFNIEEGAPPPVKLSKERSNSIFIREIINNSLINSCHDVSDGGIAICLVEMAMASEIGFTLKVNHNISNAWLFGEDQGRYIISCKNNLSSEIIDIAKSDEIRIHKIGKTGGKYISFSDNTRIEIDELNNIHKSWLPNYMSNK